jgi:hypothetical protein
MEMFQQLYILVAPIFTLGVGYALGRWGWTTIVTDVTGEFNKLKADVEALKSKASAVA